MLGNTLLYKLQRIAELVELKKVGGLRRVGFEQNEIFAHLLARFGERLSVLSPVLLQSKPKMRIGENIRQCGI